MKLVAAQMLASKVAQELEPFCERIAIAGSIRRERPSVNDIDLVLIPLGPAAMPEILKRCKRNCVPVQGDACSQNIRFKWPNEFQLDLWIAHAGDTDLLSTRPSNWGAVLLCRTGSMVHNTQLASLAMRQGMKFAPYRGILKGEEVIAGETEASIYEALGLPWLEPTEREVLRGS